MPKFFQALLDLISYIFQKSVAGYATRIGLLGIGLAAMLVLTHTLIDGYTAKVGEVSMAVPPLMLGLWSWFAPSNMGTCIAALAYVRLLKFSVSYARSELRMKQMVSFIR